MGLEGTLVVGCILGKALEGYLTGGGDASAGGLLEGSRALHLENTTRNSRHLRPHTSVSSYCFGVFNHSAGG